MVKYNLFFYECLFLSQWIQITNKMLNQCLLLLQKGFITCIIDTANC